MDLKATVNLLVIFANILPPTLQQPMRRNDAASAVVEKTPETYVEIDVRSTESYRLVCSPEELLGFEDQDAEISWTYKGDPMPWPYGRTTFGYSYYGRTTLVSSSTNPNDEGIYECTVSSTKGFNVTKTFSLCITMNGETEKKPVATQELASPAKYTLPSGRTVLTCEAYIGTRQCLNPAKYYIVWSKLPEDGGGTPIPLTLSNRVNVINSESKNGEVVESKLEFKKVQLTDYGDYLCNVTNKNGELLQNFTLINGVPPTSRMAGQLWAAFIVLLAIFFFIPAVICFCLRYRVFIALYIKETFYPTMADGYMYDVFVIHGETAFDWVGEVLKPNLEDVYGYHCFFPSWDIICGANIIDTIAETVLQCRRVIVVVTPCLLRDRWASWALKNAFNAAMNTPTRLLPIVLQKIKGEEDPHDIQYILDQIMIEKIKVPRSCGLKEPEGSQEPPKKVPQKSDEDATRRLKPVMDQKTGLRSRSRSPRNQRLRNMTNAVAQDSVFASLDCQWDKKQNSEDIGSGTESVIEGEEEKEEEQRVGDQRGEERDGRGYGRTMSCSNVNHQDEEEEEEEEPDSPCSITPFIFDRNSTGKTKDKKRNTWLDGFLKVLITADDKELFWQSLRLGLAPPMALPKEGNEMDV